MFRGGAGETQYMHKCILKPPPRSGGRVAGATGRLRGKLSRRAGNKKPTATREPRSIYRYPGTHAITRCRTHIIIVAGAVFTGVESGHGGGSRNGVHKTRFNRIAKRRLTKRRAYVRCQAEWTSNLIKNRGGRGTTR